MALKMISKTEDLDMQAQLASWQTTLQAEVAGLEQQLDQLRVEIKEKRDKIAALDKLIGGATVSDTDSEKLISSDPVDDVSFTPVKAYWKPILEALVELGGRGRREKVIELVGKKMAGILTAADRRKLPNSNFIRWENRIAWQVSNMRVSGMVKKGSPRGVWEITDAGREWLGDNS